MYVFDFFKCTLKYKHTQIHTETDTWPSWAILNCCSDLLFDLNCVRIKVENWFITQQWRHALHFHRDVNWPTALGQAQFLLWHIEMINIVAGNIFFGGDCSFTFQSTNNNNSNTLWLAQCCLSLSASIAPRGVWAIFFFPASIFGPSATSERPTYSAASCMRLGAALQTAVFQAASCVCGVCCMCASGCAYAVNEARQRRQHESLAELEVQPFAVVLPYILFYFVLVWGLLAPDSSQSTTACRPRPCLWVFLLCYVGKLKESKATTKSEIKYLVVVRALYIVSIAARHAFCLLHLVAAARKRVKKKHRQPVCVRAHRQYLNSLGHRVDQELKIKNIFKIQAISLIKKSYFVNAY